MKKKVGVHRLAERANVSIGTVDRALHGRPGINEKTRERILRIAREIGYEPNLAARALSRSRTHVRIGVCVPREIHFFYDQLWEGIYDEVKRFRDYGIDFIFRPVPELGKGETPELKKILSSRVQGVILTPGRPTEITPVIDAAEEKGVRVVCVSTDAPASKRSCIVCVEPRLNGLLAGELMGRFVPAKAKVAVITGMLRTEDHLRKTEGFAHSFPEYCSGGQVVEIIEAHEDPGESFRKTSALLARIPDLSGIYVNTVNCLPVCKALEARNRALSVKLITTDLFQEMVPYFEKQTICASIYQRPYQQGRTALATLVEHLSHNAPLSATYLNPSIVLRSNLHLFREVRRQQKGSAMMTAAAS
ncbi:MAG TPA: LacI family DNA-binding transcriptional regulator [Candidatus Aquilonibacter sp.]|nr:LacI family DNA-binding transcriptional regulator [Candidatus Aquilonibacter sp.]